MAVATAAKQVIVDRMDIVVAGGVESISLVQTGDVRIVPDPELVAQVPDIYMLQLQTAEVVAARYNVSREYQDQYSLQSQQRTAAAQAAGDRKSVRAGKWLEGCLGSGGSRNRQKKTSTITT